LDTRAGEDIEKKYVIEIPSALKHAVFTDFGCVIIIKK
jgi:hypothetical protein